MDFFREFFLDPILSNGWFNPVNSIAYGMVLVVAVYFVFRLLRRMSVRIDRHFLYAVLPFVLWASVTRVLHDAAFYGALAGPLGEFFSLPVFPTPGSYFITFTLALTVLAVSLAIQKYARIAYWKSMVTIGLALCAVNFAVLMLVPAISLVPVAMILGITGLWSLLFFLLYKMAASLPKSKRFKPLKDVFTLQNSAILSGHMLDASATFVAMAFFGYSEQHPLPRFLIELSNPAAMFLLKLVVLIPVLYIIDRYSEKGEFRNFLKIVILILGLAPGLRDMIRLMAGV